MFCFIFVLETKNLSLEETAALFDGDEATEKIAGQAIAGGVPSSPDDEKASFHDHHVAKDV